MTTQERMSAAEFRDLTARKKNPRNKFGAVRTTSALGTFDSKGEHNRFAALSMLQTAGAIRNLQPQTRFPLYCGEQPLMIESALGRKTHATYIADYTYDDVETGIYCVEDWKGTDTKLSQLKRAVLAIMLPRAKILVTFARAPQPKKSRTKR
jgi:hypothetical protein